MNAHILFPAILFSQKRQLITAEEAKILHLACELGEFKAGDIKTLLPRMTDSQRTYQIKKMIDRHLISPVGSNARIYIPNFGQSNLIRGVIDALRENDFISGLDE